MIFKLTFGDRIVEFLSFDTAESQDITKKVLTGEAYKIIPFASDVKTIVDIGANLGAASVYLSLFYPNAKIFSVEPQLGPFNMLAHNTKSNPNIKIFHMGLLDCNKEAPLYLSWADTSAASIGKSWLNTEHTQLIKLRDAAEWLQEENLTHIDILKIDTEGCEIPILSRITKWLPTIQIIYVEYHSESDRRAIDNLLANSHVLVRSKAELAHRGELVYARSDLGDDASELHKHRIRMSQV
mgnify:CR=1 FL=1